MVRLHVNRNGHITGIHRHHRHRGISLPRLNYHTPRVYISKPVDPRAAAIAFGLVGMVSGVGLAALGIGLCFAPGAQPPGIALAVIGGVLGATSAALFAVGVLGVLVCCKS